MRRIFLDPALELSDWEVLLAVLKRNANTMSDAEHDVYFKMLCQLRQNHIDHNCDLAEQLAEAKLLTDRLMATIAQRMNKPSRHILCQPKTNWWSKLAAMCLR